MGMTLRSYDSPITQYRRDYMMKVDTRFDEVLGKLAYQLRTSKAAIYREGAKEFMRKYGIEVSDEWL